MHKRAYIAAKKYTEPFWVFARVRDRSCICPRQPPVRQRRREPTFNVRPVPNPRKNPKRFSIYLNTLVSIFENNISILELIVSPNPFSGELNVLLKNDNFGIKKAVIYDAVGKSIFEYSFSNKMEIKLNTAHLNNGFYFLKIILGNDEAVIKKIILQK
ncbi:MAG TPA: T9SS type A sorting domain-containing protein [Bacteroidetes bacterium]|nr:T9SS type A sorting domain-containing protein [Bacteroidota bacterium]